MKHAAGVILYAFVMCVLSPRPCGAKSADTTHSWYHYRICSVFYDSTQLDCVTGEVFLQNEAGSGDTIRVRWSGHFGGLGLDTTRNFINQTARTEPFALGDAATLSFFRCQMFITSSEAQWNMGISDTVSWTLRLMKRDGSVIAMLDSIVIFPKMAGMSYPEMYSTTDSSSVRVTSVMLEQFQFQPSDSGYLQISIGVRGPGSPGFTIRDVLFAHAKWSDAILAGM